VRRTFKLQNSIFRENSSIKLQIMNDKIKFPSGKEQLLKGYYRRYLVFMTSCFSTMAFASCVGVALLPFSRKFIILAPLVVLVFLGALFVFSIHFRSILKKDGVDGLEWMAYALRQPYRVHVLFILAAILIVMFVAIKCAQHFYPRMLHAA